MKVKLFISAFLILFLHIYSFSQVAVNGPTCVVSNLEYQYRITGNWDSSSVMQVCVSGGTIISGATNCQNGSPSSQVRIIWNALNGILQLSSSKGDTTLQVRLTSALAGGSIDDTVMIQTP